MMAKLSTLRWIVNLGKITVFDYTFTDWKTMSDEKFRKTYERCD